MPSFHWFFDPQTDPNKAPQPNKRGLGIITFVLGLVPFVREGRGWALGLAAVVAVVETLNGIAHISAALYFGGYVPGVASAPLLLILGVALLRELTQGRAES